MDGEFEHTSERLESPQSFSGRRHYQSGEYPQDEMGYSYN